MASLPGPLSLSFFPAVLLAIASPSACNAESAPPPTNIIFILADDLGYGDLGCYGQTNFSTPHIDRMAAQGMRFTQHYSGSTVCAPSRACLLTGQHTGHVYQRANGPYQFRADPEDMCVASRLRDAGYATAMIGKSGLSCNSENGRLPNEKGFSHFFGYTSHRAAHRYYPPFLWRNGNKVTYPGNHGKEGDTYSGDLFREDALGWIEANHARPFFLHLSLQQPHADLSVPQQWKEPFLGKYEESPAKEGHYRGEEHPKSTFAGMVTYLDDTVGQVIDKLQELGIAENTLVIFSSDNGPMNEGGWEHIFFDSNGPLRGCKRDLYEGGVRVPMIAWQPGTIEPGSVTDHVSAFWDFAPTACELAGLDPPADADGLSYLPTLLGQSDQPKHEHLYWEFHEQGGKQAVRWGDWKGVRLNMKKTKNPALELYNLAEDPAEAHDVADQYPEVVAKIVAIMQAEHTPSSLFPLKSASKQRSCKK